mmetsp:Transcript_14762/g.26218  ORF Transcript_14762/g.26218 Transcript_14762/m.26218 type:complete len:114 (-) Transcript_14762:206-547(-)
MTKNGFPSPALGLQPAALCPDLLYTDLSLQPHVRHYPLSHVCVYVRLCTCGYVLCSTLSEAFSTLCFQVLCPLAVRYSASAVLLFGHVPLPLPLHCKSLTVVCFEDCRTSSCR